MSSGETTGASLRDRGAAVPSSGSRRSGRALLIGGGTDGNEILTNLTGVVLIVLLAILGVTILRVRQLISVHLFVGLLLLGPVALKMASTGYRFARYYLRDAAYRVKGPPETALRMMAPIVVLTTVVVFVSGLLLLFGGPSSTGQYLALHKVSFILWLMVTGVHVLAHLPGIGRTLGLGGRPSRLDGGSAGAAGRWIVLAGALIGGLVLAIVLIPDFTSWTSSGAFPSEHG